MVIEFFHNLLQKCRSHVFSLEHKLTSVIHFCTKLIVFMMYINQCSMFYMLNTFKIYA